jgi:hypothetical protein
MLPTGQPKWDRRWVPTRLLYIPLCYRSTSVLDRGCKSRHVPTGTHRCQHVPTGFAGANGCAVRNPPVPRGFVGHKYAVFGYSEASSWEHFGSISQASEVIIMDMLYEVDLILGEEFLDKFDCILHYGKGCIMIRKGKRHMTINSSALSRPESTSSG